MDALHSKVLEFAARCGIDDGEFGGGIRTRGSTFLATDTCRWRWWLFVLVLVFLREAESLVLDISTVVKLAFLKIQYLLVFLIFPITSWRVTTKARGVISLDEVRQQWFASLK